MPGPFFFAWADEPGTGFDFGPEHERFDEHVFAFTLSMAENDFPSLEITIRNPRIGLLDPSRRIWAWLAYQETGTGDPRPLFFGRLVGIPDDMGGEFVQLQFIGRPFDYDEQRSALAESLKVAPYWDHVWIDPDFRDDPDSVLEARTALWHIDPVTHEVTISDIVEGEDGTIEVDYHIYDSLSTSPQQQPLKGVKVIAEVFWRQEAVGTIDCKPAIVQAFAAKGSTGGLVSSYTGEGLYRTWPLTRDDIGGGWTVGSTTIRHLDGTPGYPVILQETNVAEPPGVKAYFALFRFLITFLAKYTADRERSERLTFTLRGDCQPMTTDPDDQEVELLTLQSDLVGEEVDGDLPIEDVRRRAYFPTTRGHRSIDYLIALARARIIARARAVDVSAEIPFDRGLDLSCRKNATVIDDRLPGGEASGKIKGWFLRLDGESGLAQAGFTIGCMIGEGGTIDPETGEPVYVVLGYVDEGYQIYSGSQSEPIDGVVYDEDDLDVEPDDDGIDFFDVTADDMIEECTVDFGVDAQEEKIDGSYEDINSVIQAVNSVSTTVCLQLTPVTGGPFETRYALTVSRLAVPKTIDLRGGTA